MQDTITQIKKNVSIIDLAEKIGFELKGNGNVVGARVNKIRSEKSCSIKFYKDSNSFTDFGSGDSGSVIDLYMKAYSTTLSETIKILADENGIENIKPTSIKTAPIPEQSYMQPPVIRKIFDSQLELNFKDKEHKKLLDEYAPKWVFKSARSEDIAFFVSSVRKAKHEDTTMMLLRDEHGHEQCLKYRWKMVGDERIKWCGLDGVKSNFLYTRLTENPLTIVTEGTSCYWVAILLGYSVISIPSASYKGDIPFELTKDRELIYIGDDGEAGQNAINRIMSETVSDKKKFNYDDFRTKYKLKGTDFKDLVVEHKNADKFKANLLEYISTLQNEKGNDWLNTLKAKGKSVTREIIAETENMKMLIDGMLPHGQITTFVGQPNVGKSAITFAIINRLMETKEIENVLYFDGDNPLIYTKDRILKLMDRNGDDNITYYTGSTASKGDMLVDLELLTNFKDSGKKTLVVIDSLKNFVNGSINDDKSLNPVFDILQQVRDVFGATIIVLHHTRKGKDEDGKLNYVGSQVIEASSDNMTYLSRVEDSETMVMENSKARALLTPKLAFDLDFNEMEFSEADLPKDIEDEDGVGLIVELIEDKGAIGKPEIKKLLKGRLAAKKIEEIIAEHKDSMFKYKKDGEEWLVDVVEKEREIKVVETVYEEPVEKAENKKFNEMDVSLF